MKKKVEIAIRTVIDIELDESKINQKFLDEFSETIYKVDGIGDIIKHIARAAVVEDHSMGPHYKSFIEGIGPSEDIGLKVYLDYEDEEIDFVDY